jgi:biopolymer transport protein ExbD
MAFGAFNPNRQHAMMSEINVTPMVDVMLVLLVIFIITAPMFTHAIKLDLPRAQSVGSADQLDTISIAIDAGGKIFWNNIEVDAEGLDERLAATAAQAVQPELQLRADRNTRYETVAEVMAAAQTHGLTKLGFVTEPRKDKAHGQR